MFKKIIVSVFICFFSIIFSSCAFVTEVSKTIWGSSTRALENARVEAISQSFRCSVNECFDAVLMIAGQEKEEKVKADDSEEGEEKKETVVKKRFDVFIQNRAKRHIVVMGVVGNVNTTEVGIFLDEIDDGVVKIDISSLSTSAKRKVAKAIFDKLTLQFKKVY